MAKIELSIDTEAKTCQVLVDGKLIEEEVTDVCIYKYRGDVVNGYSGEISVDISLAPQIDNGVRTVKRICASKKGVTTTDSHAVGAQNAIRKMLRRTCVD